jgi:hypothetical protein
MAALSVSERKLYKYSPLEYVQYDWNFLYGGLQDSVAWLRPAWPAVKAFFGLRPAQGLVLYLNENV